MSNQVRLTTICQNQGGSCSSADRMLSGSSVELDLRNMSSSAPFGQWSHATPTTLDGILSVDFEIDQSSTSSVTLVVVDSHGFSITPEPSHGVTWTTNGSKTTYTFDVPTSSQPGFAWEIPPNTPGVTLRIRVKRM